MFKYLSKKIIAIIPLIALYIGFSQQEASRANWLYPDGNLAATKRVDQPSGEQTINTMSVKWSSAAILGDVKPLVGNVILNDKLFDSFPAAPNEIVAVVGDKLVIIDGRGFIHESEDLPDYVTGVSVLFDTSRTSVSEDVRRKVIMGLETIETSRAELENLPDTLAFAYLAEYDEFFGRPQITKRLSVDMREVAPNFSASVKPFMGLEIDNTLKIYAMVNTARPELDPENTNPTTPPFYRGVFQFDADEQISNFPLTDIGYDTLNIGHIAPEIGFAQPSIALVNNLVSVLVPNQPVDDYSVEFDFRNNLITTVSGAPYMYQFNLSGSNLGTDLIQNHPSSQQDVNGTRTKLRTFYINLFDPDINSEREFVLFSEQYSGVDNSNGQATLQLFYQFRSSNGDQFVPVLDPSNPSYVPVYPGGENHHWSIAVGDLDGRANQELPLYPNNPGNEIIATQTSKDFAFAGSRIHVLRYNGNSERIRKASPPNQFLNPFDTVCTQQINGWVAAVNDLDGNLENQKEEVLIVNGSEIMVLQLRDYDDIEFQSGNRFDTLYTHRFDGETISYASVADIEGDGLNDIIVTTFNRTYVLGNPLGFVLDVTQPVDEETPFCAGDSLEIRWRNLVGSTGDVEIFFRNIETDSLQLIEQNIFNNEESASFSYQVDSALVGQSGYFIVRSMSNPGQLIDSSGIVIFNLPEISDFYMPPANIYKTGDIAEFSGEVFCYDSLELQLSLEGTSWTTVLVDSLQTSSTFLMEYEIPCFDFFNTYSEDADSSVSFRIITHKAGVSNTSSSFDSFIEPADFPFILDSTGTADPTKIFRWDGLFDDFPCDSVLFQFSTGSNTFNFIGQASIEDEEYRWSLPTGLPDQLLIRAECLESCVRTDTLLSGFNTTNIKSISPNPFRPQFEQLEIIYFTLENTNVSIKIYDQSNRLVAEPITNQMRVPNTIYTDRWDGRTLNGSFAHNGLYYIVIEFGDGIKEIYPLYIKK